MKRWTPTEVLVAVGLASLAVAVAVAASPGGRRKAGQLFSLAQLSVSGSAARLGLDNTPDAVARRRLAALTAAVLDPLQRKLRGRLRVTSGFRTPQVNAAISGSSSMSQHMSGEAADVMADGMTAYELAQLVLSMRLPFDQMIWYAPERGGHLHLSYTAERRNRGEVKHAPAGGGYTKG